MSDLKKSNHSIIGSSDNRPDSPIVDWDGTRPFRIYNSDEVFNIATKKGKWFPNVNDLIVDYNGSISSGEQKNDVPAIQNSMVFLRVTFADKTSLIYKTVITNPTMNENNDSVVGGGGPDINSTYRVYIDTSKYPATMRVDSRLKWTGSDNNSYRVFRGYNISETGEVISANIVDGKLIGNTIDLALAAIENTTNISIMAPLPGYAKGEFYNYEPCTIVVYGDNDVEASIARAYIVLTNMHMSEESSSRTIQSVRLVSPFISPSDENMLMLPINLPLDDIIMHCEVTYSDGVINYAVDGTKAAIDGLRNSGAHDNFYISSLNNQRIDINLKYFLSKEESYVGSDLFGQTIVKDYVAVTQPVDGAYSVKLFVVPEWLDVNRGYRLRYYLCNLDRGYVFDATSHIEHTSIGNILDPKLYGVKQTLSVRVNLHSVSSEYVGHIHVQTFSITLLAPGTQNSDPYLIEYNPTESVYGKGCKITFDYDNVKYWRANVNCGATDKSEWLQRMFRDIHPLYDRRTESECPEPTHFEVVINEHTYTRVINDWMNSWNIDFRVDDAEVVYIRWIKRTPTNSLMLGVTPLIARQI